jgi:serine/threonine protein kinase
LFPAVQLGDLLGGGHFGRVYEIASIKDGGEWWPSDDQTETTSWWPSTANIVPQKTLNTKKKKNNDLPGVQDHLAKNSPRSSMDVPQYGFFWNPTTSSNLGTEEEEEEEGEEDRIEKDIPDTLDRQKIDIIHPTMLRDGQPRYAVKMVRPDLNDGKLCLATMDMACELKLLSALCHPNVIRVHAVMGSFGHPKGFGIIMDRLAGTLQEKMLEWANTRRINHDTKLRNHGSLLTKLRHFLPSQAPLSRSQHRKVFPQRCHRSDDLTLDRLLAIYDVICGMKYLHSQRIVFRDLKTPNVGEKLDGGFVLFDFGIAKELKIVDLVQEPDMYRATGMTGTRAFMAPEVAMFRPYGFSADVYSFGMLMWEVMALEMAYSDVSSSRWHYQTVVLGNARPRNLQYNLPPVINDMIVKSWSADPKRRPTFDTLCHILYDYLSTQQSQQDGGGSESNTNDGMTESTPLVIRNRLVVSPEDIMV